MSKPEPTRYRVTNWKVCNEALKCLGLLLNLVRQGHGVVRHEDQPAWTAFTVLRCGDPIQPHDENLFGLPLRQTTGMVGYIFEMAGSDWPVPDLATLGRRQKHLAVQIP